MARKGEKLSAETKRKVSESMKRRFREELAARTSEPDHKRCSKCREFKPVEAFHIRNAHLRSGVVVQRPYSWCKACTNSKRRKERDRMRAEGKDLWALQKRYEANEDREARLARRRAYETRKRREEGRPVRGPRKWQGPNEGEYLDVEPLAAFLERMIDERARTSLAKSTGVGERRLHGILKREYATVSLRVVDDILSGLGVPHELHFLYPDTEALEKTAGYKVIST